MCGIVVMASLNPGEGVRKEALEKMVHAIRWRGPDDLAFYMASDAGIGVPLVDHRSLRRKPADFQRRRHDHARPERSTITKPSAKS